MVEIAGTLTDADTLSGGEQTPIYLNNKIVAVTDEDGNYTLDVPPGDYRLEVRPREFLYVVRDVQITKDGQILDKKTGKRVKKTMPLTRATL